MRVYRSSCAAGRGADRRRCFCCLHRVPPGTAIMYRLTERTQVMASILSMERAPSSAAEIMPASSDAGITRRAGHPHAQKRQGLSAGAHRSQYHSSCMRIPWENSRIADDFEWSLVHEPQILHLPQFGLFAISIISDEIYSALCNRARAVSTLSSNAA